MDRRDTWSSAVHTENGNVVRPSACLLAVTAAAVVAPATVPSASMGFAVAARGIDRVSAAALPAILDAGHALVQVVAEPSAKL